MYLPELIDDLFHIIRPAVQEKDQYFEVRPTMLEHETIISDNLRLQKILINILSNAVKYTPENGHIIFEILEEPTADKSCSHFCFSIQDDGIGMSEEFHQKARDHVFTRFWLFFII